VQDGRGDAGDDRHPAASPANAREREFQRAGVGGLNTGMSDDPKIVTTDAEVTIEFSVSVVSEQQAHVEFVTYPQRLLSVARKLIDEGEFSLAVVVAHMACEIATEASLSEAFGKKGIPDLEKSVMEFVNGHNLANERIRKLYTALTGDNVQNEAFWAKFKPSSKRRNDIIHNGLHVGKAEAEESYKVTNDLVAHLKK
jgi:hypothetical protein